MSDPKERWKQFTRKKDVAASPSKIRIPASTEEKAPAVGVQQYTPTNRRYCKHPKEQQMVDTGSIVGRIVICRLCGSVVNDPDLAQ